MSTARILILEDDDDLRGTLTEVLGDQGYAVTAVSNGQEAVDAVCREDFDLIVADIRMKGMSGLDAVELSKKHQPDIGTVIVSGYATPENTARAMKLQTGGILSKPFQLSDLLSRVHEQLGKQQKSVAKSERRSSHEQSLLWALNFSASAFNLPPVEVPTQRYSELGEALARQLGFSSDVSQEVGLACALCSTGRIEEDVPEDFLADVTVLPTLKYCLAHYSDPLDLEPRPRLEARIVALCLEAVQGGTSPFSPPDQLPTEHFDDQVIAAYKAVLEQGPENTRARRSAKGARSLLSLADTLLELGELEGAERALQQVCSTATGRPRLRALLGLARLALRKRDESSLEEVLAQSVAEAEMLGPLVGSSTLLEAGLLKFRAGLKSDNLLKQAISGLARLGFDGSVALATMALMSLGHRPNKSLIGPYLDSLSAPRYADEVAASTDWLIPKSLQLFTDFEESEHQRKLLRFLSLYPAKTAAELAQPTLATEKKIALIQLAGASGSPRLDEVIWEALKRDPKTEVAQAAQKTLANISDQTESVVMIRCHSFGAFQVYRNSEAVSDKEWRTKKVRYYFAFLASRWGTFVSEDSVLEVFWPKKDTAKGKKNHYWTSSMVRRALGSGDDSFKEIVERREELVRLNPEVPYWHDVSEFEKAFDEGTDHAKGGRQAEARNCFAYMAELYRGPYLEGYYQDWAVELRNRFEEKALQGLLAWADCSEDSGEPRTVLEAARRVLEIDSADEDAHAHIMKAHLVLKEPRKAVEQYEISRMMLEKEMGVEPGEELQQLLVTAQRALA